MTLFKSLYGNAESCVRVNGTDSTFFTINSGVRQGCVAAPDLFNCVLDYLMSKVCEQVPGVQFGSRTLADLEYADDTAMLASSFGDIRRALIVFSQEAKKLGLVVNWAKTELIFIGDGPIPPLIYIDDEALYFVPTFVYLGSLLSHLGSLLPEINRRRGIAAGVM